MKKHTSKLIALVLALCLCLSLSSPARAPAHSSMLSRVPADRAVPSITMPLAPEILV